MKALEINSNLKGMYTAVPGESDWKREKEQLMAIIKKKNKEIKQFRLELDHLLASLAALKGSSAVMIN